MVLELAGYPNEYNTNTFQQYVELVDPEAPFLRFMNDPAIQEILHVRGTNLPGLNFVPETYKIHRTPDAVSDSHLRSASSDGSSHNPDNNYITRDPLSPSGYFTPGRWETCNDNINEGFGSDKKTQSVSALQYLSNHIRVMLYSGEFDLNTNILGTLKTLQKHIWLDR